MKKSRRFTWIRVLVAITMMAFFFGTGWLGYSVGEFYQCLDDYSGAVARGDQLAARDNLAKLHYFQQLSGKLKPLWLDDLAGEYFFGDFPYYEAAYDYLASRHKRVTEKMQNKPDFWGRYLRANSSWRIAQGIFAQSLKVDSKARGEMQKKADQLALATKDDYEAAIRIMRGGHLPSSWNYDLTTKDESRAAALRPKPGVLSVKLGEGGKKNKGMGRGKGRGPEGDGSRDLNIEGPPGEPKQKSGSQRPG